MVENWGLLTRYLGLEMFISALGVKQRIMVMTMNKRLLLTFVLAVILVGLLVLVPVGASPYAQTMITPTPTMTTRTMLFPIVIGGIPVTPEPVATPNYRQPATTELEYGPILKSTNNCSPIGVTVRWAGNRFDEYVIWGHDATGQWGWVWSTYAKGDEPDGDESEIRSVHLTTAELAYTSTVLITEYFENDPYDANEVFSIIEAKPAIIYDQQCDIDTGGAKSWRSLPFSIQLGSQYDPFGSYVIHWRNNLDPHIFDVSANCVSGAPDFSQWVEIPLVVGPRARSKMYHTKHHPVQCIFVTDPSIYFNGQLIVETSPGEDHEWYQPMWIMPNSNP